MGKELDGSGERLYHSVNNTGFQATDCLRCRTAQRMAPPARPALSKTPVRPSMRKLIPGTRAASTGSSVQDAVRRAHLLVIETRSGTAALRGTTVAFSPRADLAAGRRRRPSPGTGRHDGLSGRHLRGFPDPDCRRQRGSAALAAHDQPVRDAERTAARRRIRRHRAILCDAGARTARAGPRQHDHGFIACPAAVPASVAFGDPGGNRQRGRTARRRAAPGRQLSFRWSSCIIAMAGRSHAMLRRWASPTTSCTRIANAKRRAVRAPSSIND